MNPVPATDFLNLDQYFDRIGYGGPRKPTEDVLHALTRAHSQSIPFENLDVLLRRPIRLEPEAIFQKLVVNRRGGYCFEQNGLLMEVLRRIGFVVHPLRAGVRLGETDRRVPVRYTHLILEVSVASAQWITDVGVGSASLTRALRFVDGLEQPTPHEARRLVRADGKWFHQIRYGSEWVDVYEFTGESMPLPERIVANWYTSTCPDQKFRRELFAARALPDGSRVSLHNHELSLRKAADGSARKRTITDPDRLLDALREHFGIALPEGTRFDLEPSAAEVPDSPPF